MTKNTVTAGYAGVAFLVVVVCTLLSIGVPADCALSLEGPTWLLLEVKGTKVEVPSGERKPFITFNKTEERATGYSGCNDFFGSYALKGEALSLGPLGMTRRFCGGAAGDVELAFLQALRETRAWRIENGILLLLDGTTVLARLEAPKDVK
ncbi:MAG TPA: META domain-containing protein [Nitrospirota bacterium]|nr:META domain-containing protein [Nitrospirota bacterium]